MCTGVSPNRIATRHIEYLLRTSLRCSKLVRKRFLEISKSESLLTKLALNERNFLIPLSTSLGLPNNSTAKYPLLDFLRKEVIQPHLPIRLPCYDFTPVIEPAFDSSLPLLSMITFLQPRDRFRFLRQRILLSNTTKRMFRSHAAHAHQGLGHWLRAFPTPMV